MVFGFSGLTVQNMLPQRRGQILHGSVRQDMSMSMSNTAWKCTSRHVNVNVKYCMEVYVKTRQCQMTTTVVPNASAGIVYGRHFDENH